MIPGLSVVIPTLDAAPTLEATLRALGVLDDAPAEIVVADGGSRDPTPALARSLGARVVHAPQGRGPQLAAGIAAASGPWLLLLHADTRLQPGWQQAVRAHLADAPNPADGFDPGESPNPVESPGRAGHFCLALDSPDPRARRLERMVAWRCRVLHLPYGDQGLLLPRTLLDAAGGMPRLPLMEDVALVRNIRRLDPSALVALDATALTSAAPWERDGWLRRSARNLLCLALWRAGLPPAMVARVYALARPAAPAPTITRRTGA